MKKILLVNIFIFVLLFFFTNMFFLRNVEFIISSTNNLINKINNRVKIATLPYLSVAEALYYYEYPLNKFLSLYTEEYPENFQKVPMTNEILNQFCEENRIDFGTQYKSKKPIIILGCSYLYGHGLSRQETFPYILSNLTKRRIYSFSSCGGTLPTSYWRMTNIIDDDTIKSAEYFIHLYMYDHINRYLQFLEFLKIEEDLKNKNYFFDNIFLIKYIKSCIKFKNIVSEYPNFKKSSLFVKQIIKGYWNKIKEKNPNAKFIIILYDEKIIDNYTYFSHGILNSNIWKELEEEENIIIVRTKDINGFLYDKDYKLKADIAGAHPSARVWKEFTPKFIEEVLN